MNSTGALYQWEGAGTPPAFCILEGSANIMAASAKPGSQLTSEPPMQLWGAAELKINMSKDFEYRYFLGLGARRFSNNICDLKDAQSEELSSSRHKPN